MRWETYNFTNDFQDAILACLLRHPADFYAFGEIIKPEYFSGAASCEAVQRALEYKRKYGKFPNFGTLANFAFTKAARVNVDHANDTLDYVEKLAEIDTSDKAAILDLSVTFAKERALYDALKKIHSAQVDGKRDEINPVKLIEEAMSVGMNLADLGLSLYHHSDEILDKVTDRTYGVMTGYKAFDDLWKFGWCPGWLIVPLAPPKRFKTAFAINLALKIVQTQNVDVLYYACEISQELAALRAITNITGWTQDQIFEDKEKAKIVTKVAMKEKMFGTVWFKGYPSKSTSISEIRAHAKQIIGVYGLNPKVIVIDYAETVRPDTVDKKAPDWRQQADIYTQARALGAELGCCVIMPDRCNKETVGRQVPNMKSFQGAFEKAGIVDAAIGLCSTDDEYIHKRLRYFVFLNRHGDAYKHFDGKVDPERMKLTVGAPIDYHSDADDDEGAKPRSRSRIGRKMARGAAETQRND